MSDASRFDPSDSPTTGGSAKNVRIGITYYRSSIVFFVLLNDNLGDLFL